MSMSTSSIFLGGKAYSLFIGVMVILLFQCTGQNTGMVVMEGATQGTYYRIHVSGVEQGAELQRIIEQELLHIDQALSLWRPGSIINRFNAADTILELPADDSLYMVKEHFKENLRLSQNLSSETKGYFDPSIAPVVQYWGFGADQRRPDQIDSSRISTLLALKGLHHIRTEESPSSWRVYKHPGQQLDFNAIAQGYTVDHLCGVLKREGYEDFLVDIGGECRAQGHKPQSKWWTIGINTPDEKASGDEIMRIITLKNQAISTSGNYRRFAEINGQRVVHTIQPFTGMAFPNTLLSASVTHSTCARADAWATALMAMGLEQAKLVAQENSDLGVCLIYSEGGQYKVFTNTSFPPLKQ